MRQAESENASKKDREDQGYVGNAHGSRPSKTSVYPVSDKNVGLHPVSLSLSSNVRNGSEADIGLCVVDNHPVGSPRKKNIR